MRLLGGITHRISSISFWDFGYFSVAERNKTEEPKKKKNGGKEIKGTGHGFSAFNSNLTHLTFLSFCATSEIDEAGPEVAARMKAYENHNETLNNVLISLSFKLFSYFSIRFF